MQMESQVLQVNIDDIIPNRFQPRLAFDEQGLKELSDSIKEHGIIQPLVLRKLGSKYEIIAGERRYKAAQMAGLSTVPAVISNIDDNSSAEIALVENIQRKDLTPIEEAKSYKNLLDKGYLTQEKLAKKMGLSQASIANKLRLLNLSDEVQQALLENKISERHARALLSLETHEEQTEWLNKILTNRLTVRQLDQELKKLKNKNEETEIPLVNINPNLDAIKASAQDLNVNKTNNVSAMMVPDDVLTDYSEMQDNALNNVVTPNFIDNTPLENTPPSQNNKYFNSIDTIPSNEYSTIYDTLDMNLTPKVEKKEMEIIGDSFNSNVSNQTFTTNSYALENDTVELNPNNKFFTSLPNEIEEPKVENKQNNFDPMQLIDDMVINENQNKKNDAILEIKNLINKLQTDGVKITLQENDNLTSYQIIINIE